MYVTRKGFINKMYAISFTNTRETSKGCAGIEQLLGSVSCNILFYLTFILRIRNKIIQKMKDGNSAALLLTLLSNYHRKETASIL